MACCEQCSPDLLAIIINGTIIVFYQYLSYGLIIIQSKYPIKICYSSRIMQLGNEWQTCQTPMARPTEQWQHLDKSYLCPQYIIGFQTSSPLSEFDLHFSWTSIERSEQSNICKGTERCWWSPDPCAMMVLGTLEPSMGEQRRVEKLSMTKNIFSSFLLKI